MRPLRDRLWTAFALRVACVGVNACALAACGDDNERSPLPDWSDGYEQGGPMAGPPGSTPDGGLTADGGVTDLNAPPPDTFAIRHAAAVVWPLRIRDRDALARGKTKACFVEKGDPATELVFAKNKKVRCLIDSDELDLHQLGLQFDVVVPEGMCDFVLRSAYIYENFETGVGPTKVSFTRQEDGSITDEVNAIDGKPYCRYDYKFFDDDLPNCCYGSYTKEVKSAKTGKVSRSLGKWGGGKLGDCYYGGGYLDERAEFDTEGFPVLETVYVQRQAAVLNEVFKGPDGAYSSNIALANYYVPEDHGGRTPAALRSGLSRPMYSYYCLDDAEETIAYIEITVREWNEEVEFDADGDPYTTGTEEGWNLPVTDRINDWSDWKDIDPDGETFPNLPHL